MAFADLCQDHGFTGTEVARHQTGRRKTLSVTTGSPPLVS
jgi:hypothetical protein